MKRYNIGIILDRTGSVILEKEMLKQSIILILEALKNKYSESLKKQLFILCIGEQDVELYLDNFADIDVEVSNINKNENIYEKIEKLFEKLKNTEDSQNKVFLFSDGYFNRKEWKEFVIKIKNEKYSQIDRIAIGISEGYDDIRLMEFSEKEEIFEYRDVYDLV